MHIKIWALFSFTLIKTVLATNKLKPQLKPNILLLIVDDLRPLLDGSVNLTNIQRLAANSVYFKNAFAQQALCAPSRNSMLTGRRPDALRLYDFYSYWRTFAGNYTTLPQYFKQNGYETYSVGKIFHPGKSSNFKDDYPFSWSDLPYHAPTEIYKDAAVCLDAKTKKFKRNLICPVDVKQQPGGSLPDLQILNKALEILDKNKTGPFFLAVGFHKPHIPLKFPKEYLDKIPINTIQLPEHPEKPDGMPLVAWHTWNDVRKRDDIRKLHIDFPFGTMPKKWTKKIKQSYNAAITYIDDLVGKLLSKIDAKNTIIVFTSDHGWSLGENGLWAKYSNFDVALKVPLMFSIPYITPKTVDTPVELIDVFPSLANLARLPAIPKCRGTDDRSNLCSEGKSLVPFMKRLPILNKRHFAISQYPRPGPYPGQNSDKPRLKDITIMGYSIRTKRFRYTEWISFNSKMFTRNWDKMYGAELYDHFKDPYESNNQNNNSQYKFIKIYLSKVLRSHVDPN